VIYIQSHDHRKNRALISQHINSIDDLKHFLDTARSPGVTDQTIVALLRGREWPEEDVYRVFADHFESRTGIPVPGYKRSGSAKDAFLYLFCFSTLVTWTPGLGSILFTLIERWFLDPLAPTYYYRGAYYQTPGFARLRHHCVPPSISG
jgi:hypothetical protein